MKQRRGGSGGWESGSADEQFQSGREEMTCKHTVKAQRLYAIPSVLLLLRIDSVFFVLSFITNIHTTTLRVKSLLCTLSLLSSGSNSLPTSPLSHRLCACESKTESRREREREIGRIAGRRGREIRGIWHENMSGFPFCLERKGRKKWTLSLWEQETKQGTDSSGGRRMNSGMRQRG